MNLRISFSGLLAASLLAVVTHAQTGSVPHMVALDVVLEDAVGRPVASVTGATFAIYANEHDVSPLWMETQNIRADAAGHYQVQLGSTRSEGVPAELFTSGAARWLGISIEGAPEKPRVLLLSVPYAMKAGDAQTLGGLPASAFQPAAGEAAHAEIAVHGDSLLLATPDLGGGGTLDFVPLWIDNAGNLGNSALFQSGSGSSAKIGINTTMPLAALDVRGGGVIRGTLTMPATGAATAGAGKRSQAQNFTASAYNSSTGSAVNQTFQWQAEPALNGTPTPSATYNLLFGSAGASPAETGLSIAADGQITFAPGQIFPGGGGTITGITAGTDLTGGGSTGNVTLNLDTTKVAELGAANAFIGNQSITGNLTASGSVNATGEVSGATAVFSGSNTSQIGQVSQFGTGTALLVQQNDMGTASEIGLFATASGKNATAIEGYANNASTGAAGTGVSGAAFGSAGIGVLGIAESTAGGTGVDAISASAAGIAAVLDNIAGGKILSARHNGAEVFNLDGAGNMQANGNISTQGGQAIIRSAATPGVFTNTAGGTILVGYNNNTQKFSLDGSGNVVTSGSVSATSFSGSGSGLTSVAQLNANNTFTGSQTVTGNFSVVNPSSPVLMQTSGKDASGTGIQNQTINTSTSGTSYAVFAATSSAGVTAELVADGLGNGPLGMPSGYFGTYTNQPIALVTYNTPRMMITAAGNVGIGTITPGALLEADAPAISGQTAIFARGGSTNTLTLGASAVFATGGLNNSSTGSGGAGITATGGLALGMDGQGGDGVVGYGGQGSNTFTLGGEGGAFFGGNSTNSSGGDGIFVVAGTGAISGYGAEIFGNLSVAGAIYASTKDFRIDHPQDPANRYLVHASVESSEMLNIYTGNVTTDTQGDAVVVLPQWFQELNTDFRYQLTVIGQFAQAIVAKKINNSQFAIKTDESGVEVSWQVTCVRQDPYAKAHPLEVEPIKPERERGYYIHPELYGARPHQGLEWARHPGLMQSSTANREVLK